MEKVEEMANEEILQIPTGVLEPVKWIAILVAWDYLTKGLLITQDWAWHASDGTVWKGAVVATFGVVALHGVSPIAGVLLVAGSLGNMISALTGPVANPFVLATSTPMAFNLADCFLAAGFVLLLAMIGRGLTGRMVRPIDRRRQNIS